MYYQETQGVGVSVTPNLIAQDEQDGKRPLSLQL